MADALLSSREEAMKRHIIIFTFALVGVACGSSAQLDAGNAQSSAAVRETGKPPIIPAYYDDNLFNITFKELPAGGEQATHDHNKSQNTIWQCDACAGLIDGGDFVSVLDAIQGDGFNPIWEEHQINFAAGVTPVQYTSDNDVLAAQMRGDITITDTDEMYICAVLGPKKK
jgi:hypothetical protein